MAAFPTVSAPYGFKPINRLDGLPYAGATRQYPVTSGQAIYNGQPVQLVTGGTVSGDADLTQGSYSWCCSGRSIHKLNRSNSSSAIRTSFWRN
jgi:hypothetical protein